MAQVVYQIDSAHSAAHFSVRHMMVSNVRGEFTKLSGSLAYDASNPANTSLEARMEVASINTRDEQRDAHLKSADFLDAEKFPELTFRSKQVTKDGDLAQGVTGGNNLATVIGVNAADVSVSASINLLGGQHAGLVAR